MIVVRAYGSSSSGNGTIRITKSALYGGGTTTTTYPTVFEAGSSISLGSYAPQMHVLTVEEQRGQANTVFLLADQADPSRAHATAFDDDNALGLMSFVHANEGCSSGSSCVAFVGTPWHPGDSTIGLAIGSRSTTLLWDPDMHVAGADPDADGLSTALESALGTLPNDSDTDHDGLIDGIEVIGGNEAAAGADWRQVRYPYFGANPLHKDVFVQADWNECKWTSAADAGKCKFDPNAFSEVPTPDRFRFTPAYAEAVVAEYAAAGIAAHIDIGVNPTGGMFGLPPVSFAYGAWGGAARRSDFLEDNNHCQYRVGARATTFHFQKVNGTDGGQAQNTPSACAYTSDKPWDFAHELGHQLNLDHEPKFTTGLRLNGAPNYVSIMNYSYSKDRGTGMWPFSDGSENDWDLLPTAMDEGTPLTATRAAYVHDVFNYKLQDNRVDWNRDGYFTPGTVKAASSWNYSLGEWNLSKVIPPSTADSFTPGTALSWLPASAGKPSTLFWFVRKLDHLLAYTTGAGFSAPSSWTLDPIVQAPANLSGIAGAPAAIRTVQGAPELVLAVPKDDGSIVAFRGAWHAYSASYTPLEWSAPKTLKGPTSPAVSGGLAATIDGTTVSVFAATFDFTDGYRLHEYTWNLATDATSDVVVSRLDGSPVVPDGNGVGVTQGYAPPNDGALGAVVSGAVLVVPERKSTPTGVLYASALHTYLRRPGGWRELPSIAKEECAGAQPSIAYVPFDAGTPASGRFYVSFRSSAQENNQFKPGRPFHMVFSEGNQPLLAGFQRMDWPNSSTIIGDQWRWTEANVPLLFDPAFHPQIQMAEIVYNGGANKNWYEAFFAPYADNIIPLVAQSQSDLPALRGALRCSMLGGDCDCRTRWNSGCE